MKPLLTLTARIEWGAGEVLAGLPHESVTLWLGSAPHAPAVSTVAREAAAALPALGTAAWFARHDRSWIAVGVVGALAIYNVGAVAVFVLAGLRPGSVGVRLWPVAALQLALAVWCFACLRGLRVGRAGWPTSSPGGRSSNVSLFDLRTHEPGDGSRAPVLPHGTHAARASHATRPEPVAQKSADRLRRPLAFLRTENSRKGWPRGRSRPRVPGCLRAPHGIGLFRIG